MRIYTREDLRGKRFKRFLVVGESRDENGQIIWKCRCDCGNIRFLPRGTLRKRNVFSCGCYQKEKAKREITARNTTHGMTKTRTYKRWKSMKVRCYRKTSIGYHNYGGRGIKVFSKWRSSFEAFLAYMGECPPGMTLDRVDNNSDYRPGNCQWATRKQQNKNRRDTVYVTAFGETKGVMDWVMDSRCKVSANTLRGRIQQYKWSAEKAISHPLSPGVRP